MIFNKVRLPLEPLLWPQLLIEVTDEGGLFGFGGCEYCYTTLPLIEFADEFIDEDAIKFAKAQLNKNQNKLALVQKQIDPEKFLKKAN